MIVEDGNNIDSIFYFLHISKKELKILVELPINTTFDLKFSCSTGDEWNLVYNKKKLYTIKPTIIISTFVIKNVYL